MYQLFSKRWSVTRLWGRGLPEAFVAPLIAACGFLEPDLTVLLDIDAGTAERRLGRRGGPDRIESAGGGFMARVTEELLFQFFSWGVFRRAAEIGAAALHPHWRLARFGPFVNIAHRRGIADPSTMHPRGCTRSSAKSTGALE